MANKKITDLPAATALGGTELFESVQSATSVKATATQIKTFVGNSLNITSGVLGSVTISNAIGEFDSITITTGNAGSMTVSNGTFNAPVLNSATLSGAVGNFSSLTVVAGAIPYNTITNRATGQFESHVDQTAASANVAYVVQLNNAAAFNAGITIASSTNVTVAASGIYSVYASLQFANADSTNHVATFWFRKNGTNIPNSASVISVPKVADGGKTLGQVTIFESMTVSSYIQLVWSPDNTNVSLDYTGASGVIPEVPSVIFNMTRIA
jgi:hypothetical protein